MKLSILIPNKCEDNIVPMLEACEREFPEAQTITAVDRHGRGKGWALREALRHCEGDVVAFIDGDMDIHPRMIRRLLPFIQDYDIVVGKKQIRGLLSRRILTLCSRLYIWVLFGLNIDTQTGVKLFRREAIPHWVTNDFSFDVEVLAKAKRANRYIIEVPVDVQGSKPMKVKSILKCLWSSFKIWKSVILAQR
jgi:glycosyltransferase involved in cell wall biosynthesis